VLIFFLGIVHFIPGVSETFGTCCIVCRKKTYFLNIRPEYVTQKGRVEGGGREKRKGKGGEEREE
jgi:hypothetical protein